MQLCSVALGFGLHRIDLPAEIAKLSEFTALTKLDVRRS